MGGGPRQVTDSWEHMWWDHLHWKRCARSEKAAGVLLAGWQQAAGSRAPGSGGSATAHDDAHDAAAVVLVSLLAGGRSLAPALHSRRTCTGGNRRTRWRVISPLCCGAARALQQQCRVRAGLTQQLTGRLQPQAAAFLLCLCSRIGQQGLVFARPLCTTALQPRFGQAFFMLGVHTCYCLFSPARNMQRPRGPNAARQQHGCASHDEVV